MAYFSNGSEGSMYEEQWCSRCVHNDGCTVWLAHLLFNYDLCNKDDPGNQILEMLIPTRPDGFADKCTMFHEKP